jgi:hypothetical protein
MVPRAALKKRHVLFSTRVIDAMAPMRGGTGFQLSSDRLVIAK